MNELYRGAVAGLFALVPIVYVWIEFSGFDWLPGLGFSLLLIQSTWIIFMRPGDGGTLVKTYFLFMYIFVGMVPFLAFANDTTFLGARRFTENEYLIAVFSLIAANQLFYGVYWYYYENRKKKISDSSYSLYLILKNRYMWERPTMPVLVLVAMLAMGATFVQLYRVDFSVSQLLYRNVWLYGASISSETVMTRMVLNVVRYSPAVFLIYVVANYRRAYMLKAILLILTLVSCFPTGIARFVVAALYLPLVFMMVPVLIRSIVFPFLLIFGVFYVFPLLNQFRHMGLESSSRDTNWLFHGHFDSFQSYILAANGDVVNFGKQLLGVFLFFIPRALWPDKPFGTGRVLAEENGLRWLNASANFYSEAFVNFGFFGVAIFATLLGLACARLDSTYKFQIDALTEKQSAFFTPFFLILLGYTFLFLRGDMLTAISAFATFVVPLIVIHVIACKF